MKLIKLLTVLTLCGLMFLTTACQEGNTPTPQETLTPTPTLQPPTLEIPTPEATSTYPNTPEGSIDAIFNTYRQKGYEAVKTEWMTSEFAITMSYTDFLATTIEGTPTSPSALKSWKIMNIVMDASSDTTQKVTRVLVQSIYEGDTAVCRWLFLLPPDYTGDHWRIAGKENASCDTGQALSLTPTMSVSPQPTTNFFWSPCPGAMASMLRPGILAYVSPIPPLANRLRQQPGLSGTKLTDVNPGEIVTIIDGPSCADGMVYWKVEYHEVIVTADSVSESTVEGWMAEGQNGVYWMLPCPATGPCGGGFVPVRTASP